jgi:DNA-binding PadR family transcriptional regulator
MPDVDQLAPEAFLPLTPAVFHILLALADGEKHGYAIMQEVEAQTGDTMRMGPGTLYGSIQRMLKDNLIVEAAKHAEPVHGEERRRYYRLTSFGQRVLQAEAHRLEQLVHVAHSKRILPGFDMLGGG